VGLVETYYAAAFWRLKPGQSEQETTGLSVASKRRLLLNYKNKITGGKTTGDGCSGGKETLMSTRYWG